MGGLVPVVHRVENRVGLVDDDLVALAQLVQLRIGDQQRNLDDPVGVRRQPGHLHVDPDQVALVLRHSFIPPTSRCILSHA
jgi:hypothetical protein